MISSKNLLQDVSYRVQENITWHSFSTSLAWHKEQILKSQFLFIRRLTAYSMNWDNQTPWVCFLFWPWLIYCCYINLNFGPKLSLTKGLKNSKLFTGESSDTKYASPAWKKKDTVTIGHFTVVCSVPWPLNRSEAGRDLVLLKTFLLFICKSWYSHANKLVNMIIYIWKTRRFVTKQGRCQPRFYSKARALSTQL